MKLMFQTAMSPISTGRFSGQGAVVEMLVHLMPAGEELEEVAFPDGDGERHADGGPHRT